MGFTSDTGGPRYRPWWASLRRFLGHRLAVAGAVVILLLAIGAAAAPFVAPEDPARQDLDHISFSPSHGHPLGTDVLGRDTLSRLIYGARTSISVGVLSQLIVLAIAIPVGLAAGAATSRVDNLLMRGVDIVYAFPDLLLIILLRAVFGGSLFMIYVAIGLASWPTIARLVRGQVLSLREREYVLAARATGAGGGRIVLRHLLPNVLGPVIVAVTLLIPRAIFAEAALSYIGIGVSPPTPSWGSMVEEGYGLIAVSYHQMLYPILAIGVLVVSFTFLGNGLRDLLDPRTRLRK